MRITQAMSAKDELRRAMRDRLPLPPDQRGIKSARICAAITALPQWQNARTVALFAAQQREPDVEILWQHAIGKVVGYPRVETDGLSLFSVESLYKLQSGQWNLREPNADPARLILPADVDLILVPGVAFTRTGARCGRGGGYYDRLLASLSPHTCKIGVCFDFQIVPELPNETHDIGVDFVIAE
jgi:5-formyltetrahydrofolate cyclo-ligase